MDSLTMNSSSAECNGLVTPSQPPRLLSRASALLPKSLAMAAPTTQSDLVKASNVIAFLDFSAVVAAHMANVQVPTDQQCKPSKANNYFKQYIAAAQDEPREVPTNSIAKKLHHITTRCMDLAKALIQPIAATITALATEEIDISDPQRGWELVCPQVSETRFRKDVAQLTDDFVAWLGLAWK